VVFVIDTSGSMHGPSLEQATLALSLALDNLSEFDSFNVIQFNSVTTPLFPESVPVTEATLAQARQYIHSLVADGGTVMRPAVEAALADHGDNADVRQVIFVTDGAIGNEHELFTVIASQLGRSRLFTVGIGAAPNSHFMRKAAQFGRGTFTYIGSPDEISERMDSLFHKLEEPVVADVAVEWPEPDTEAWPPRVPDLYAGEPLVVAARLSPAHGSVVIRGQRGSETWQQVVSLEAMPARGSDTGMTGIGKLWARRQIDALMDGIVEGMDRDAVRRVVTDLALRHHLLTKFTSLVAVDVTPSAPLGLEPLSRRIPARAPSVRNGVLPQTATAMPLHLALGLLCALAAAVLRRRRASTCR
jgi:Ca-activated chloride channel family protein